MSCTLQNALVLWVTRPFPWLENVALFLSDVKVVLKLGLYISPPRLDSPSGPRPPGWDTPHSVGFLWTSKRPVAETSTWQHVKHSEGIWKLLLNRNNYSWEIEGMLFSNWYIFIQHSQACEYPLVRTISVNDEGYCWCVTSSGNIHNFARYILSKSKKCPLRDEESKLTFFTHTL
jgi:hypothetical protein